MKFQYIVAFLAGLTAAAPAADLEARQTVGISANDLAGPCREIIFIFARGSTEIGNMGSICGPETANGLRRRYGAPSVAVQGVDYRAGLATNFLPQGADPLGTMDMANKLVQASRKCPSTIIVAGGYSQGAAITHASIQGLPIGVKNQIAGVVTFGDTQRLQDLGAIPGFPRDKLLIICAIGDTVCDGTLIITAAHLVYAANAPEAVNFLAGKIDAVRRVA
ncbi:carbohydrate esterase family 5 protein [Aulographum hederae CBS 113979]|uniref:Cutinase n=1 Tax=Aulographum hederae CBS 113979 TaxID=1176131 RepID=A0A6G1H4U3_9PEZI|nr:carbohydrate esterase family 5 protein [Aulographum hederae CBS 113979]